MTKEIETVEFRAGEVLFEENEVSFHFFIIQEGEVEVYKTSPTGDVTLARVGPGNSIGEFAMLDRQPRSASAKALSNVTCAKVSPDAYERLLDELPDWAVSVMRALVERLRFTNNIVREIQKSTTGTLHSAAQKALDYAEYSDSESRVTRIQQAESRADDESNFDFSIYEASAPKANALKSPTTAASTTGSAPGKAIGSDSLKPTRKT